MDSTESSSKQPKNILFIGNPGVGKSTLLNSCMKYLDSSIENDQFFKSGLVLGDNMGSQLDIRQLRNRRFIDTPGLQDIHTRPQAAATITKALRLGGLFQIVFVVTLKAGRIHGIDSAMINVIVNSVPEITHFGLIFNKVSKKVYEKLQYQEQKEALLDDIMMKIDRQESANKPLPIVLCIKKIKELEESEQPFAEIPDLEKFMEYMPPVRITAEKVNDISGFTIEEKVKQQEQKIKELEADNNRLRAQIYSDREEFHKQYKEIVETNERQNQEELDFMQYQYSRKFEREQKTKQLHVDYLVQKNAQLERENDFLRHNVREENSEECLENQANDDCEDEGSIMKHCCLPIFCWFCKR